MSVPGELKVLTEGPGFFEGPRWRDGRLWFSDFHSRLVKSYGPEDGVRREGFVAGQPSGLGFGPAGETLVVSSYDRRVVALNQPGPPSAVASTWALYPGALNDMYVDPSGRAYISPFDANPPAHGSSYDDYKPDVPLLMVEKGVASIAATGLAAPNGIAASPDGKVLIVAETFGYRLSAFDIGEDGALSNRRTFADLGDLAPDGICVDQEGAVWVGCVFAEQFIRVAEGGRILDTIATPGRWAVAPALGGPDGRTLFGATARTSMPEFVAGTGTAAIEAIEVGVGGL
jgi:sugar lactone lactonase YvrE